jgi:hypothetical protein
VRRLSALLLAALGLLSVPALAQEAADCRHPRTQAEAPMVGFLRVGSHDYEAREPGLGCSIRLVHAASSISVDLYIYRAGLGEIADLPRDERLMANFQSAVQGIRRRWEGTEKGRLLDLQARYVQRGLRAVEVMAAQATIELPSGEQHRTHLLLWSGSGSIWKLRATFPVGRPTMTDAAVEEIGTALVDWSRAQP